MSATITPPVIVEPFAASAAPPHITQPIPVAPGAVGIASFDEGFPPATMTAPGSGGVPPSGADMNGILYMLSAFCQMLQAGQRVGYDATASTAFTGYVKGAVLRSTTPGKFWTNNLAGNTTDPDTTPDDWISSIPLYAASAPSAGAHNNVALAGPSDFVLDLDTTAGNATYSGFVAQRDGQRLTISNTGANLLTLAALATSSAANQFRLPTDLALVQNQTVVLQYSTGAGKWVIA